GRQRYRVWKLTCCHAGGRYVFQKCRRLSEGGLRIGELWVGALNRVIASATLIKPMNWLLIVEILAISTMPLYAQGAQPDVAQLKANGQKALLRLRSDRFRARSTHLLPRHGPVDLFPGVDAALDVTGGLKADVLRGLHRHRRAFTEGAVKQNPLVCRYGQFVQHAAGTDLVLQAR